MRVGWDARILVNGERRGMGTYACNVLQALRECRPDIELRLFHDRDGRDGAVDDVDAREIGPKRGYRWQLWERVGLPFHAYTQGCDLVHSPANTTPPRCPLPRVVTLHDALPFHDWNESANPLPYFHDTQRRAIRTADAIITDSRVLEGRHLQHAEGRAIPRVCYSIGAQSRLPSSESSTVTAQLKDLDIRSPFIVALAASARRKNTLGVLRAFAALQHEHREVALVLTSVGPRLRQTLQEEMKALQIDADRVRFLDFVSQQQLAALYAGCDAFWFLSLFEGFGLPILDAMRCGAVVVCSTRTSCPEVAGDAAVMVDPEEIQDAVAATLNVLGMDGPARERWRARALAHAATFTWQRTATMTAQVYSDVAGTS